jgi:hypothetical protein
MFFFGWEQIMPGRGWENAALRYVTGFFFIFLRMSYRLAIYLLVIE